MAHHELTTVVVNGRSVPPGAFLHIVEALLSKRFYLFVTILNPTIGRFFLNDFFADFFLARSYASSGSRGLLRSTSRASTATFRAALATVSCERSCSISRRIWSRQYLSDSIITSSDFICRLVSQASPFTNLPGLLYMRRFCASIAHSIFFSGNDETEFSKKFVKPPIPRKSHIALPARCAVSHSTL